MKRYALIFLFSLFFFPHSVFGASLSITPQKINLAAGETVYLNIVLDSPDEPANAVSGEIVFPINNIEVVSVNKGSLVDFWVEQPSFSNSQGIIKFEGVIFNPGFSGKLGKILTLAIRGKTPGQALLQFQNATILANDGEGTNITQNRLGADLVIGQRKVAPIAVLPGSVAITSPTHPDSSRWYRSRDPRFSFVYTSGTQAISLVLNNLKNTNPPESSKQVFVTYQTSGLTDGQWYLHARAKRLGAWGEASHFLVQIDSEPPRPFEIDLVNEGKDGYYPEVVYGTTDDLSGLDRYEVFVNGKREATVKNEGKKPYHVFRLPLRSIGISHIRIDAIDNAGNIRESSITLRSQISYQMYVFLILLIFSLALAAFSYYGKKCNISVFSFSSKHGIPPKESRRLFKEVRIIENDLNSLERDIEKLLTTKDGQKAFSYLRQARARNLKNEDIRRELSQVGWKEYEIDVLLQEEETIKNLRHSVEENLRRIEGEGRKIEP